MYLLCLNRRQLFEFFQKDCIYMYAKVLFFKCCFFTGKGGPAEEFHTSYRSGEIIISLSLKSTMMGK